MADQRQQFVVSDFSPGIRQIQSPLTPPGVAHEDGTFGCLSHNGALIPAPKLVDKIAAGATLAGYEGAQNLLSSEFRICGIFANDPVYSTAVGNATIAGPDQCNTELWVGIEFWDDAASPFHRRVARYHRHRTTPSWETVYSSDAAGTYASNVRPKRCEFANSRSNHADPATPGPVVVAFVFAELAYYSPDESTPTSTSTKAIPADTTNYPPNKMVAHQGRIVIFPLVSRGANTSTVRPDNEAFYWTAVNDLQTRDALLSAYEKTVAYIEQSHGYEWAYSLTSDTLLLMKRSGGALVLQGDLNAFRADPKPFVQSPGLALNQGALSPIGIVYPVDNGTVWVCEGGDTSREIAKHMDPNFWRPSQLNPANGAQVANGWGTDETSCARWGNYVLFPSNWVCDTEGSQEGPSWWRLDDPSPVLGASRDMHWWTTDWTGRWAWGAPSGYANSATSTVLYEYDMQTSRESYSWQSHPHDFSLGQRVLVEDLVVSAAAQNPNVATIKVTVSSNTGDSVTQEVYVPSSDPMTLRFPNKWGVRGTGITVKIEVDSNQDGVPAPTVYGYEGEYSVSSRVGRAEET